MASLAKSSSSELLTISNSVHKLATSAITEQVVTFSVDPSRSNLIIDRLQPEHRGVCKVRSYSQLRTACCDKVLISTRITYNECIIERNQSRHHAIENPRVCASLALLLEIPRWIASGTLPVQLLNLLYRS